MKSWVWVLAVADTQDEVGTCISVFDERSPAQVAFKEALKRFGGNRRYDVRLAQVTSVESFLVANPLYRPTVQCDSGHIQQAL
jgi:hypothetical protein